MSYSVRIAAFSLLLVLLTALVIWRGAAAREVSVLTQSPTGEVVAVGTPIRIIFSQPVDQRSVEERFTLTPETTGSFFWDGQSVTFQPDQPLRAGTSYRVSLQPGIADRAARTTTQQPLGWTFRTRNPRLLLLRHTPDGTSILLLSEADGSNPREILREPDGIVDMIAAPDGSQAILVVPRTAERMALLRVDLQDGRPRPLVDTPDLSAAAPAWSPNGNLIAFEQRPLSAGTMGDPAVWLAQPDGTSFGPVTEPGQIGTAPVWSPDSRRLAFHDAATGSVTVYNFTSTFQIFPDSRDIPVTWAADSSALLYVGDVAGRLRRANLETGETTGLPDEAVAPVSAVAWSPDGAWLALVQGENPGAAGRLWLLRPDGSEQQQLSGPAAATDSGPVWSPDSRQLAFLRDDGSGTQAAWLLDLDTDVPRQVATDVARVVWLP